MGDLLEQALDDDDEYETTDTEPVVEPVAAPRHSRAVSGQPSDQVRWWSLHNGPIQFNWPTSHTVCIERHSSRQAEGREGREGQGRVPDCLGGLSRVGISSRSTRPWNGQPPSTYKDGGKKNQGCDVSLNDSVA